MKTWFSEAEDALHVPVRFLIMARFGYAIRIWTWSHNCVRHKAGKLFLSVVFRRLRSVIDCTCVCVELFTRKTWSFAPEV